MSDEEVEFPTLIKNWPKDRVDPPEEEDPESGDPFTNPPEPEEE